jgi:hypothetical protein
MPPRLAASFVSWPPIGQHYQIAQEARPTALWLPSLEVGTPTSTAKLTSSPPRWPSSTNNGMLDKDAAAKADRALKLYEQGVTRAQLAKRLCVNP